MTSYVYFVSEKNDHETVHSGQEAFMAVIRRKILCFAWLMIILIINNLKDNRKFY